MKCYTILGDKFILFVKLSRVNNDVLFLGIMYMTCNVLSFVKSRLLLTSIM